MGILRYQCSVSIFLIFQSIMRINIRKGGNKNRFLILFFSNLSNNNVGGSVNQSIIKKDLRDVKLIQDPNGK